MFNRVNRKVNREKVGEILATHPLGIKNSEDIETMSRWLLNGEENEDKNVIRNRLKDNIGRYESIREYWANVKGNQSIRRLA